MMTLKQIFLALFCLVSCLAFGQVGDGRTDDTQAIQLLIDQAGPGGKVHLKRPSRFYRLTDTLRVGKYIGFDIEGEGETTTRLVMDADNRPIVAFVGESHTVRVEWLSLEYLRPQNAKDHPRSTAIAELNEDGQNRPGGLFRHTYRNLWIKNATRGFSVIRDYPNDLYSVNPWWGSRWESIVFANVSRSLIDLNLGATGAPCNRFEDLLTMKGGNDGQGAAFRLRGEAIMGAIDIEDWCGQLLYVPSGGYVTITGLHVERHKTLTKGERLIEVANCRFEGSGWLVHYLPSELPKTILYLGPNASGEVRGLTVFGVGVTETSMATKVVN